MARVGLAEAVASTFSPRWSLGKAQASLGAGFGAGLPLQAISLESGALEVSVVPVGCKAVASRLLKAAATK